MSQPDTLSFIEAQHAFIEQRPTLFSHDTDPLAVIELLKREIAEFEEAYENEYPAAEIAREAADIAIFTITLFKILGLNLSEEVLKKIQRNHAKYPVDLFKEATFEEAAAEAKQRWIHLGGDEAYYG